MCIRDRHGGDDYELLAAVPRERAAEFEREAAAAGVAVMQVGEAVAGARPPVFVGPDGGAVVFGHGSYSHF